MWGVFKMAYEPSEATGVWILAEQEKGRAANGRNHSEPADSAQGHHVDAAGEERDARTHEPGRPGKQSFGPEPVHGQGDNPQAQSMSEVIAHPCLEGLLHILRKTSLENVRPEGAEAHRQKGEPSSQDQKPLLHAAFPLFGFLPFV